MSQTPLKAVASPEMVRNALEDQFDPLSEPPKTEHTDHPLWPRVRAALAEVYDPEIPVNIYELGLIYKVDISESDGVNDIFVEMTLTSPACPVAQEMPGMVQSALMPIESVGEVRVEITFDPPWDASLMAETAKLQLNIF